MSSGIIDESDVLLTVYGHEERFREPVRRAMSTRIETLQADANVGDLLPIFDKGHVAIVIEGTNSSGSSLATIC